MATTKRVPSGVTENTTKRVAGLSGAVYDPWGGAWGGLGGTWGASWLARLALSVTGATARVPSGITENTTRRVSP